MVTDNWGQINIDSGDPNIEIILAFSDVALLVPQNRIHLETQNTYMYRVFGNIAAMQLAILKNFTVTNIYIITIGSF